MAVKMLMKGAILPGNSTVELKDFEIPKPGYGQVVVQTKATTICGSDIRCIYREHTGKGPEGYIPGMVAGHEPCGQIVEEGEGLDQILFVRQDIGRHSSVPLPAVGLTEPALTGNIIAPAAVVAHAASGDVVHDHPVTLLEAL